MTTQDKRQCELAAILERIKLGWSGMDDQTLTPEERVNLRKYVLGIVLELSRYVAEK